MVDFVTSAFAQVDIVLAPTTPITVDPFPIAGWSLTLVGPEVTVLLNATIGSLLIGTTNISPLEPQANYVLSSKL
jgi:hypothetical protein